MVQFLIVIHTIVSVVLIVVILMQSGQGGLNSMMGGVANSMLGSSGANNFITKLTTWLGITFIALALLIGALSGDSQTASESIIQQDADSRETEMPVTNEYILPSDEILPEESKE
ncbi:MAG: preprotein translocase subunit SecG [Candidatus Neomarinimicrobiota bacterium]|jgi:preprotein translocase subunit SecG|uniref:Protein-export membrane protein SecG n=1 Tax=marine metagenome TaxID=408172 RepID=A0A381Q2Y4_9ZZZZ|nr:preprotein translocase subunit SecG [Candidatus Neomarinimicrobiota bacterium]